MVQGFQVSGCDILRVGCQVWGLGVVGFNVLEF